MRAPAFVDPRHHPRAPGGRRRPTGRTRRRRPRQATVGLGAVVGVVLAAAVLVAVMVYFRFAPANIALAAVAVAVVGVVLLTQDAGHEHAWPRIADAARAGYRHEVSQLSWSMTGPDGRLTEAGVRRLRAVARGRLALHGLDLDDDAERVRELVGPGAYATLTPPRSQGPTARAVSACLDVLERLGPADPALPPATTRTHP